MSRNKWQLQTKAFSEHVEYSSMQILSRSTSGRMPWLLTATHGGFDVRPHLKTTWALKKFWKSLWSLSGSSDLCEALILHCIPHTWLYLQLWRQFTDECGSYSWRANCSNLWRETDTDGWVVASLPSPLTLTLLLFGPGNEARYSYSCNILPHTLLY